MIKNFSITGEKVCSLGIGTHGHGHAFGGINKNESHSVFMLLEKEAIDGAKILIDTAPRYGHGIAEKWIQEYFEKFGDSTKYLVATKGGRHITPEKDNQKEWTEDFLRFDIDGCFSRLQINKIFLYQLHNPNIDVIKEGRVFSILEDFRNEGLIDWYGVSINTPGEGIEAIKTAKKLNYEGLIALQAIYSILNKKGFDQLADIAEESNIAIMTREVMLRGFLTYKYTDQYDFTNSPPAITKLINWYGKDQIFKCVKDVKEIIQVLDMTLAQASLRFSIDNPQVTVTLAGINRVKYFQEDWGALKLKLPKNIIEKLKDIKDIMRV